MLRRLIPLYHLSSSLPTRLYLNLQKISASLVTISPLCVLIKNFNIITSNTCPMSTRGSGSSSEDSLSSTDRKIGQWDCLHSPIPVSINKREKVHNTSEYAELRVRPSDDAFKFVATALSNALTSFCSRSGHEALRQVAIEICEKTKDESKLSDDMKKILADKTSNQAHDWVVAFRNNIFKEFPVIYIDEQVDEKQCWAVIQIDTNVDNWRDHWHRMISLHISKWLVDSMCNAAKNDDTTQFQNYLLRVQNTLCHEVGGHILRAQLLGPQKMKEHTPPNVGSGTSFKKVFADDITEAGFCLERFLFGGKCVDLIDQVNTSTGYQAILPCIWVKDNIDPNFMYAKEIPRNVIEHVTKQGQSRDGVGLR